jgi:hypothetical protein
MGKYDLDASVDYILKLRSKKSLTFICHGEGASSILSAVSNDMQYWESRINHLVALAPMSRLTKSAAHILTIAA